MLATFDTLCLAIYCLCMIGKGWAQHGATLLACGGHAGSHVFVSWGDGLSLWSQHLMQPFMQVTRSDHHCVAQISKLGPLKCVNPQAQGLNGLITLL